MNKKTGIIICVVLGFLLLGGIGVWIKSAANPADATYSVSWQSDGKEIYFNEVNNDAETGTKASAAKLVLPEGTKKELTLKDVNQYYGRDMSKCYIPGNLKKNNTNGKFDFYYDGNKVASDRTTLWYSAEGESTHDLPYLEINFEKGRIPLSDTIYSGENRKESTVNGKKVVFTAEFPEGSAQYTAEFLDNNIGYRIRGCAISQEEFMKVVYSLIN